MNNKKELESTLILIDKFKTFGLDEFQHNLAIAMIREDIQSNGNIYLDELEDDELNLLIEGCELEDKECFEFLSDAYENNAKVFTLSKDNKLIGYVTHRTKSEIKA